MKFGLFAGAVGLIMYTIVAMYTGAPPPSATEVATLALSEPSPSPARRDARAAAPLPSPPPAQTPSRHPFAA